MGLKTGIILLWAEDNNKIIKTNKDVKLIKMLNMFPQIECLGGVLIQKVTH
jgi:hypothetical protein